jgi:hypothetical protein
MKGTDWEAEEIFADNGQTRADPVVVKNKKTNGRIFIGIQNAQPTFPTRGEIVNEFILNWLARPGGPVVSVEPIGKMSTSWGKIKAQY